MHIPQKDFEKLVVEAVEALPPEGLRAMDNVAFMVESEVRPAKAEEVRIERGELLLGLYEGVSKAKRGAGYSGALPDRITIFQKPIEELSGDDPQKLKEMVFDVVRHEVGHHLGFDEPSIRAHEKARKKKNQN